MLHVLPMVAKKKVFFRIYMKGNEKGIKTYHDINTNEKQGNKGINNATTNKKEL